jgi:tricarballylate dehydrogenase
LDLGRVDVMADLNRVYDVLVVGGGNAALCALLTAREAGASVLLLEHAPRPFRGGNSRHTRNLRCMHLGPTRFLNEAYPEEEFFADLMKVTGGVSDEGLARLMIRESANAPDWMHARGVRFQHIHGTLSLARTNPFFLGGGTALLNAYYQRAGRLGAAIRYDSEVLDLDIEGGVFRGAGIRSRAFPHTVRARSLVVASGGYQADIDWLKESWGEVANNFIIRGTPYNRGRMLKELIRQGAQSVGDPQQCHAVAIDARSPRFDAGIVTRLDCVPFGIVVNRDARRFYDEGEDFWPKRYAIWGRLVAGQPGQIAYVIIDAKAIGDFMPSLFRPVQAESIGALGAALGLDPGQLDQTVADFNKAVRPGIFDPTTLDDCATTGLSPPKSHWARPIDTPPFYGYPLRPGITFTYLGVKVDERARVLMNDGRPAKNIYATGEIMAGNILGKGYMAGTGMTIGTVFGRIAGREAARHVKP